MLFECAKLCFRFGKASLLASRATTPALKPNHEKPPFTAIRAYRPTPGSKLPSAAKREQALALKKRCRTKMLFECAKLSFRFGKASLLASRATTPTCEPNHEKPSFTAIHAHRPTKV